MELSLGKGGWVHFNNSSAQRTVVHIRHKAHKITVNLVELGCKDLEQTQLFFKRCNELPVSTKDREFLGPLTDIHFLGKDSACGASSQQNTHAFECQTPKKKTCFCLC